MTTSKMIPTFLQLHVLTSFPAALLNRDDSGQAKRIPFGRASRLRISSQCLKRHWRTHEGPNSLAEIDMGDGPVPMAVRSRLIFSSLIRDRLVEEGMAEELATRTVEGLMKYVLGSATKEEKTDDEEGDAKDSKDPCAMKQVLVLGRPEVDFLVQSAREISALLPEPESKEAKAAKTEAAKTEAKSKPKKIEKPKKDKNDPFQVYFSDKERKKNLEGLFLGAGLDAALFGRMITGSLLARSDAAIHVAHAFTVHEEQAESDFFSALDDLIVATESGHINQTELTSGLYYTYVAVDIPLLISNLTGVSRKDWKKERCLLAREVIRRLVHIIATVSPGAKLGSTAPHGYASFMMVEKTCDQPRSLANAFLDPVDTRKGSLLQNAYEALAAHLNDLNKHYPGQVERRIMGMGPVGSLDSLEKATGEVSIPLPLLAAFASEIGL